MLMKAALATARCQRLDQAPQDASVKLVDMVMTVSPAGQVCPAKTVSTVNQVTLVTTVTTASTSLIAMMVMTVIKEN